jgi:hypothetical protein
MRAITVNDAPVFKPNDITPAVIKPQKLFVIIENAFTPHIPKLV